MIIEGTIEVVIEITIEAIDLVAYCSALSSSLRHWSPCCLLVIIEVTIEVVIEIAIEAINLELPTGQH